MDIEQFLNTYRAQKALFTTQAKELFKNQLKTLFDKHLTLQTISWTQYTPYFMDGDPCVFGVNPPTFTSYPPEKISNVSNEDFEDPTRWSISEWAESNKHMISDQLLKDYKDFSYLLTDETMTQVLEDLFGDHVRVICSRDEITTREHNHD